MGTQAPAALAWSGGGICVAPKPNTVAEEECRCSASPSDERSTTNGDASSSGSHFEWRSPDESIRKPFEAALASAVSVASQYDLCLSGDALHHLQQQGADTSYVPLTQVCPQAPLESTQEPAASHIIKGLRCCLKSDLGSMLLLCVLG